MNRDNDMSDSNQRPGPTEKNNGLPIRRQANANDAPTNHLDPEDLKLITELKRGLEKTRLPADLREQILAELPPAEERERLYREIQEKGGISGEELFKSLGIEVPPKP